MLVGNNVADWVTLVHPHALEDAPVFIQIHGIPNVFQGCRRTSLLPSHLQTNLSQLIIKRRTSLQPPQLQADPFQPIVKRRKSLQLLQLQTDRFQLIPKSTYYHLGTPILKQVSILEGFYPARIILSETQPTPGTLFPVASQACGMAVNWIDVMTAKYNTSLVYTYNYAYGGATIDRELVAPYQSSVQTLKDQVDKFISTVSSKPSSTPWTSSTALFTIFIGINDIGNTYWMEGDRSAFSDTLLDAYFGLVERLYNAGGRKFLFINVPGVDRSPLMLAQPQSSRDAERVVINTFNSKLSARVSSFKSSHSGINTWVYDSNSKLVSILNTPGSYGLKDGTSYGSGSNVAWCNDYHISPTVHDIFGKEVADLIKGSGGFY